MKAKYKKITELQAENKYFRMFHVLPTQDDVERAFCKEAGTPGHWDCGICPTCNKPYFMCIHQAPRKDNHENI